MAQTVVNVAKSRVELGVTQVVATIATTVDATGATADFTVERPTAMSVQAQSTNFNTKTLSLQASNDGVNYAALPTAVALTASGIKSVAVADLGYLFYRINIDGAPLATMTVTVIAQTNL